MIFHDFEELKCHRNSMWVFKSNKEKTKLIQKLQQSTYSIENKSWTNCLGKSSKAFHCLGTCFNVCNPFTNACQHDASLKNCQISNHKILGINIRRNTKPLIESHMTVEKKIFSYLFFCQLCYPFSFQIWICFKTKQKMMTWTRTRVGNGPANQPRNIELGHIHVRARPSLMSFRTSNRPTQMSFLTPCYGKSRKC